MFHINVEQERRSTFVVPIFDFFVIFIHRHYIRTLNMNVARRSVFLGGSQIQKSNAFFPHLLLLQRDELVLLGDVREELLRVPLARVHERRAAQGLGEGGHAQHSLRAQA